MKQFECTMVSRDAKFSGGGASAEQVCVSEPLLTLAAHERVKAIFLTKFMNV